MLWVRSYHDQTVSVDAVQGRIKSIENHCYILSAATAFEASDYAGVIQRLGPIFSSDGPAENGTLKTLDIANEKKLDLMKMLMKVIVSRCHLW